MAPRVKNLKKAGLQSISKFFVAATRVNLQQPIIKKAKVKTVKSPTVLKQTFKQPLFPYALHKPEPVYQTVQPTSQTQSISEIVQNLQNSCDNLQSVNLQFQSQNQVPIPSQIPPSAVQATQHIASQPPPPAFITLPNVKKRKSKTPEKEFVFPEGDAGLPNLIVPNLDVLFIGINPGRHACEQKHHFAGPVNHFYNCLHKSELTHRLCHSDEDVKMISGQPIGNLQSGNPANINPNSTTSPPATYKIGITNCVKKATKLASDITNEEWEAGCKQLYADICKNLPKFIVFNGISTFRNFLKYADLPEMRQQNLENYENLENPDTSADDLNSSQNSQTSQASQTSQKSTKKSEINTMKILPGLQDLEICNNQVQIFAIPSSSPLARVTQNEKLFYFKEIKQLIDFSGKRTTIEMKGELMSENYKIEEYYNDWYKFFSSNFV